MLYPSSWNDFIGRDAEDVFIFEFFDGKNDTKSHTDRQSRRYGDCNQIQKLNDHILSFDDIIKLDDEDTVRGYRKSKQEDEKLGWLFLEFIFLLLGERNDSDQLAFESGKVGANDTDWNTKGFSERLKFAHFLFHVDLNDGGSFEDVSTFVELNILCLVLLSYVGLFDNWNRLTCKCTLVDKRRAFKNDSFKWEFDGIFEKDNIARNDINWRNLHDCLFPQYIERNVVVSHVEDLFVQLFDLVQVDANRDWRCEENDARIIVVFLVGPEANAEDDEQVKWSEDLPSEEHKDVRSFDDHGSWAVALSHFLCSLIAQPLVGVFKNVRDSLSVLEIHSLDGSIDDNVLHVPVDEANNWNWLILIRVVLFVRPLDNRILVVIVQDEEVSGLLQGAIVIYEEPFKLGIPK